MLKTCLDFFDVIFFVVFGDVCNLFIYSKVYGVIDRITMTSHYYYDDSVEPANY